MTMQQRGERLGVVTRIARQLDIAWETLLRTSVRQAEVENWTRSGTTTDERARTAEVDEQTAGSAAPTRS